MATTEAKLKTEKRERVGSRYSKRLRAAGRLPAVLYGHKLETVSVAVDMKEAIRLIQEGQRVFTLDLEGSSETVLLKDIQYDYLGADVVHADFERVDLNEEVEVGIHISLKGDPEGLKTAGAILLHPTMEVQVRCKVSDIVDHIVYDIASLELDEVRHASDIPLPSQFELVSDPKAVVASIHIQKKEEEGEEVAVEGEGEGPEVVSEGKEGEEAAGEADAKKEG